MIEKERIKIPLREKEELLVVSPIYGHHKSERSIMLPIISSELEFLILDLKGHYTFLEVLMNQHHYPILQLIEEEDLMKLWNGFYILKNN